MTDEERRTVIWTAAALLLASLIRFGWESRPIPPILPPEPVPEALLEGTRAAVAEEERRRTPLGPGERVDPNRDSAVELARLPGVGPALADRIVADRETNGGFARVEDLVRVPGIGAATVERLREHLEFSGFAELGARPGGEGRGGPIHLNRASASELERLPGIGPALALRIVEHRERQGPFSTLDGLLDVPGIGPATLDRLRPHLAPLP